MSPFLVYRDNSMAPKKRIAISPASRQAFVNMALPACRAAHIKYGVPISVMLAQTALESGWGTNAPGNAYFGVKGKSRDGRSVHEDTHEVIAGKRVAENDTFRSFDSFADAADDYGHRFTNPKFAHALVFRNEPEKFITEVLRCHYATDPLYKKNIMQIIRANHLDQYDIN